MDKGSDMIDVDVDVDVNDFLFSGKDVDSTGADVGSSDPKAEEMASKGKQVVKNKRKLRSLEFDSFESDALEVNNEKTQLDKYLEEPRVDRNSNIEILKFWKAWQYRYPQVAAMARNVLGLPISTVASESAFSIGGRVLDKYRSSLKPNTVEALICNRDWIYNIKESTRMKIDEVTEYITRVDNIDPDTSSFENSKVAGDCFQQKEEFQKQTQKEMEQH